MAASILAHLRSVATRCPDLLQEKLIRDATDELSNALRDLAGMPTTATLQNVNGLWARAIRLANAAPQIGDTPPSGTPAAAHATPFAKAA